MRGLHLLFAAVESLELESHLQRGSDALEDGNAVHARDESDLMITQKEEFHSTPKIIFKYGTRLERSENNGNVSFDAKIYSIQYGFGMSIFEIINK